MKLTSIELREIIKEELENFIKEAYFPDVMMMSLKDKRTGESFSFPSSAEAEEIEKYVIGPSTPETRKNPNFRRMNRQAINMYKTKVKIRDSIYYEKDEKRKMGRDGQDGKQIEEYYDFISPYHNNDFENWDETKRYISMIPSGFYYTLKRMEKQKAADEYDAEQRKIDAKIEAEKERKRKEREAYKQSPEYQKKMDKYVDSVLAPGSGNYVTGRGPQTQTFGKKKKYQAGD